MPMISFENLEPGMVLADSVHDRNGRLLLDAGAGIEARHLFIFRTWGIAEARIVGEEGNDSPVLPRHISREEFERARNRLLPVYRHAPMEHPAMIELLRLAALRSICHDR